MATPCFASPWVCAGETPGWFHTQLGQGSVPLHRHGLSSSCTALCHQAEVAPGCLQLLPQQSPAMIAQHLRVSSCPTHANRGNNSSCSCAWKPSAGSPKMWLQTGLTRTGVLVPSCPPLQGLGHVPCPRVRDLLSGHPSSCDTALGACLP